MNEWFMRKRASADKNLGGAEAQKKKLAHMRANIPQRLRVSEVQTILPRIRVCTREINIAATIAKLVIAFALVLPVAACGTKTELLMPNGKRTPQDQRDPSQPPSPISR